MSSLSQYQSVFRVTKQDPSNGNGNTNLNTKQARVVKRNRQTVSCLACRTRKLKCDRQLPCLACSKRGDASSCKYSHSNTTSQSARDDVLRTSEAQQRLIKLEQMVAGLMASAGDGSQSTKHPPATVAQNLESLSVHSPPHTPKPHPGGHLDTHGSETNYAGATHWIREIQGFLGPEAETMDDASQCALPENPNILCGVSPGLTLADACSSLPPRHVVNKLLSLFFDGVEYANPCIHTTKFLREVEAFYADPSCASFLWISMLHSALWIGSQFSQLSGHQFTGSPDGPARIALFTRAGQALVTGKYHTAKPYSVESLLLYGQCKLMQKDHPDADAWMIMGMSLRLALRMGYHRDPQYLPNISPFEGEMRRRTFSVVTVFDLLLSFKAGLPAIMHEEECDTKPPSNLFDEDFDEDCKVLPPARPLTEPTPMLYYCYKGRFANIFSRVVRHSLSLKTPSYEDTMKLDKELHEMNASIPPALQTRPLDASFAHQTRKILNRLRLVLLYYKSLCVLHRNYISHNRSDPKFAYSRKTCTDAALRVLRYQAEIYVASRPGGPLFEDKWMLSSLTLHDFLLAAMIICLDLYESHTKSSPSSPEHIEKQVEKYDALLLSHEIWTVKRTTSRDARRASNVLAAMLSKVPRPGPNPVLTVGTASQLPVNSADCLLDPVSNLPGDSLWNPTTSIPLGTQISVDNFDNFDLQMIEPLNTIFNESDNIDWGFVDQYLLERGEGEGGDISLDWQT